MSVAEELEEDQSSFTFFSLMEVELVSCLKALQKGCKGDKSHAGMGDKL